ncbi:MAG TPA: hypothetical protein VFW25_15785 [Silvibacterium sp.]|nr:hypothetical protein [Silvibacterium sp.]
MTTTTISAAALLEKAEELLAARELRPALQMFQSAETYGADADRCAARRWIAHMLRGDFPAAWRESDAIGARGAGGSNSLWRGEDLAGKRVVVRCLHGFGDAVQLLRYAPRLNAVAAEVIWEVPPALLELALFFTGVERAITWGTGQAPPELDVQIEVMELPWIFRTDIAELPIARNYLRVPRELMATAAAEMAPRIAPRVGLVWGAGEWNPSRSVPLSLFRGMMRTEECEFWNLQGGTARELERCGKLRESRSCNSGIAALAAVIAQLDLVITVDTLAAHLAGAMGKPVWLMLQYQADWRWMVNRSNSPWYSSMRLFRQKRADEWGAVVDSVDEALNEWLSYEAGSIAA